MNKNEKDAIGEMIKQVISEEGAMEAAYNSLVSIPEVKSVVDFHGQKLLTGVVRELFETYKVEIEDISFEELARLVISGKVDIPRILAKIKIAVLANLKKKEVPREKISDEELAKELSEEIVPEKRAESEPEEGQGSEPEATSKPKREPAEEAAEAVPVAPATAQVSDPFPASSDPISAFEQAMHGKISDEHIALFANLGRVVQEKFLKDGDFLTFWNEVSTFMAGDGSKMMNEWKGTTPEFLAVSCGYVIMKKLFKSSKTVKVSKIEFHNAFNVNPRSCFRAMFKVNDYLGISEPESEAE